MRLSSRLPHRFECVVQKVSENANPIIVFGRDISLTGISFYFKSTDQLSVNEQLLIIFQLKEITFQAILVVKRIEKEKNIAGCSILKISKRFHNCFNEYKSEVEADFKVIFSKDQTKDSQLSMLRKYNYHGNKESNLVSLMHDFSNILN